MRSTTPAEVGPVGGTQAAWVAADSKDKANAVFVNIPAFAILASQATFFKNGMATYCPTCKADELDVALAEPVHRPEPRSSPTFARIRA